MLFVPADRPERIGKALASGADAVIVDLEDAVARSAKVAARQALDNAIPPRSQRPRPIFLRINDVTTPWWRHDLATATAIGADGVMVPKLEDTEQLVLVRCAMAEDGCAAELIAILETARGLRNGHDIMSDGPTRTNLGVGDLSRDLGLTLDRDEVIIAPYRAKIVLDARAAGAPAPLDTVWPDLADEAGLAASAARAQAMGFGGKLAIHPKQIAPINAAFTPTAAALGKARRVAAAFDEAEASGNAAIEVDGEFVDYPVAERARAIVALGEFYDV